MSNMNFNILGVSLAYLASLNVEPDADFHVVCEEIKRITADTAGNRSLANHLMQNSGTKHLVGKAEYFVSYAWKGGYVQTMNALVQHFENKSADPFIWMDIALIDQHAVDSVGLNFEHWAETFRQSLKQIGKALLVLVPGEKPIAVSRSWCCFEWVCIKQADIRFEYCVNPEDVQRLITKMQAGMNRSSFTDTFADINVELATASKASDQIAILALMRRLGVKEVNDIIMLSVKDWLLKVVAKAQERFIDNTPEGVALLMAKAGLHEALGDYEPAVIAYEQALKSAQAIPNNGASIADILRRIAFTLSNQGDLERAERFGWDALDAWRKLETPNDDPETAIFLGTVANVLIRKGKYAVAESLYRETLTIIRTAWGNDHPNVASALTNLGNVLHERQDYDGAESHFREALAIARRVYGENHPDVALSLSNLGNLLKDKGNYTEAEALHRNALAIRKKVLGDNHPDTAASLDNLAIVLKHQGDLDGAESLYRQAVSTARKALGENHPDMADMLNNLALLLEAKGDYQGAENLYEEILAIRKKIFGENHIKIAHTLNNFGVLLIRRKLDYACAESRLREALTISRGVLGDDDPLVADTLSNLAITLHLKGDYDSAEPLYREALGIRRRVLGDSHPQVTAVLEKLEQLKNAKHNRSQAAGGGASKPFLSRIALAIRKKVIGH